MILDEPDYARYMPSQILSLAGRSYEKFRSNFRKEVLFWKL
jgi:hypothetical protein